MAGYSKSSQKMLWRALRREQGTVPAPSYLAAPGLCGELATRWAPGDALLEAAGGELFLIV